MAGSPSVFSCTCMGHPSKFQRVSRFGFVTAPMRSTKLSTMFAVSWAVVHYIYIFGCSCPQRNFTMCKIHFASKSCILLYYLRCCTALELWASAKLCGVEQRAPPVFGRAAITLGIGPHSSLSSLGTGTKCAGLLTQWHGAKSN